MGTWFSWYYITQQEISCIQRFSWDYKYTGVISIFDISLWYLVCLYCLITITKHKQIMQMISSRIKIFKGKTTTLDIMLEDSRRCSTGSCLHSPSFKAYPRQPQILECPPWCRLRGLHYRLLPLHHSRLFHHWRPWLFSLQSTRDPKGLLSDHPEVWCLLLWNSIAGTPDW